MRKLTTTIAAALAVFIFTTAMFSADQLQIVRVNGLVETGKTTLLDSRSYPIKLPIVITSHELSSMSALLPNGHGIFIKENSSISLDNIGREQTPKGPSWIGMLWITVNRGDFAVCSPEKSSVSTYTRITACGFELLGSDQSTYAVLDNQLTVTRGSVDVYAVNMPNKHVFVQAGESVVLQSPLKVVSAKQNASVTSAVLDATVEACSARLVLPSAVAESIGPTITFPIQPIDPDIVSPST